MIHTQYLDRWQFLRFQRLSRSYLELFIFLFSNTGCCLRSSPGVIKNPFLVYFAQILRHPQGPTIPSGCNDLRPCSKLKLFLASDFCHSLPSASASHLTLRWLFISLREVDLHWEPGSWCLPSWPPEVPPRSYSPS